MNAASPPTDGNYTIPHGAKLRHSADLICQTCGESASHQNHVFTPEQAMKYDARPSPADSGDRVAWLIESTRRGRTVWACSLPTEADWVCWEPDANRAIKFDTKAEAETFIREREMSRVSATEHIFHGSAPEPRGDVAYWQADSAAAWNRCEERRIAQEQALELLRIARCPNEKASGHNGDWECQWCSERSDLTNTADSPAADKPGAKLAEDRRLYGSSWERIDADGSRHRIDPRRVFLEGPGLTNESPETKSGDA